MHEDHQYIEALRRADPRGTREIYERHAREALRWVLNNHGTPDDASDIFQEAVVAVFEKSQQPDFVLTCPLGALLYLIYSRKWIDRLRQKKRDSEVRIIEQSRYEREGADENLFFIAEQATAEADEKRRLARAFAQLTDLCQRLLNLLAEGIAPREAAEKLEMNSVDTLYRRKNACVQRWRIIMNAE